MFFELAVFAYLIDMVFGEFPCKHPVVLMGDFISAFERRFYSDRILPGALLAVCLIALALLVSVILVYLCGFLPSWLSLIVLAIFASTGLAMNMLHDSVAALLTAEQPRQALSYLVSRDTQDMTETEIYKAGLETWAENLSDGVIAPLFYLLLFGLPGIAVYKAINTMDSMIAYKTERYFYFGKTAAIVDDIANYIPARLTALLIVSLAEDRQRAWQCLWRDGNKLESPNAGFPIAAMAGALGVALGSNASYHGQIKHKPTLGLPLNPVDKSTLTTALQMKTGINLIVLGLLTIGAALS
ncbi:adenosylcobinamide-phosphate synthase CbiB [Methylobacter sp.]|uniref:adenosylcobinamide-phosphate synthase CbiB n=1 Tax=Methylobacter sp. TaxID=2051955 RepID=UPI002488D7F7|nr:adenosylcobinamide-phosphate synthase CbiB [Methylobacter sp.]MDI1278134.1 adenosylcobinamide-phosphate synthase CbiB [Methylobacter sp.]MDI1358590.1 adenosylcobinamide-phosphate synthase CbiB [Methylobacter sp.]